MLPLILKATATAAPSVVRSPWFSPAGKKQLAKQLIALIPDHHTFAEPFVGSGAVFFGKQRAPREIVNDLNVKFSQAFLDLKGLTSDEIATLQKRFWTGSRALYVKLLKSEPQGRVDRLYKFMYVSIFSYGHKWGAGFNPGAEGQVTGLAKRIPAANDRMRGVIVRNGSYIPLMQQFDGPRSFFFLDPPYAGTNVSVGEKDFDEAEFRKILDGLSGRFLLTYGTTGKLDTSGFSVKRITPPRSIRHMRGAAKHKTLPTLLITNYSVTAKSLGDLGDDAWEFEDAQHFVDVAKCEIGVLVAEQAKHLIRLLTKREPAGFLTGTPRNGEAGSDFLLATEPTDAQPDQLGLGVVRLGKAIALASVDGLSGDMRARVGDEAYIDAIEREAAGDGPFYYHPLSMVQPFDAPRPIHAAQMTAAKGNTGIPCARCGDDADRQIVLAESGNTMAVCKADEMHARGMAVMGGDRIGTVRRLKSRGSAPLKRTHACRYCKAQATKALVWAEERAFVPTCDDCTQKGIDNIRQNSDGDAESVTRIVPLPVNKADAKVDKRPLTSAERNDLPDSAFMFIVAGGEKDKEGKTVPRSNRKFPIRAKDGKLDLPRLRNAIGRIPQSNAEGLSADKKRQLQEQARRLLAGAQKTSKSHDLGEIRLLKADDQQDEQFILGIVLEPEVRDSQGDIYSAEEIREAAHGFMANSQKIGLMHKKLLDQGAVIVQNYLAPVDMVIEGEKVRKGTWLMGINVIDKVVWKDVKEGRLTGLSIGGSALRVPENSAA